MNGCQNYKEWQPDIMCLRSFLKKKSKKETEELGKQNHRDAISKIKTMGNSTGQTYCKRKRREEREEEII